MTTDRFDFSDGAYVPDPERDTTAVIDGFFNHLTVQLRERSLPEAIIADMRARLAELEHQRSDMIVDEPSRYNLRMTLALVAAYEALRRQIARDDALALIHAAFIEPLGPAVREGTRAMLDAAADPFRTLVNVCKTRERDAFGATFAFSRPVDDDERYHLDVHRCFYHDVLLASSAPELTPIMCAFDRAWIDAIDPGKHGFRFDRETTIGYGGGHCPFHFTRSVRLQPAQWVAQRWNAGGCNSWYLTSGPDGTPVNANNWPGSMSGYRRRTRRVSLTDYYLSAPRTSVNGDGVGPAPVQGRDPLKRSG